ncbi:hypothetical protein F0562_006641 [Nyssa sinensis]|uniref:Uncharacterized protein n=1 Tax=Nyssa sinensis TaxID=561372 RepID=A0A5J5APG1_9ASTE|nr:hypothetical protein F0562_006641 [Nyssa sinensis]
MQNDAMLEACQEHELVNCYCWCASSQDEIPKSTYISLDSKAQLKLKLIQPRLGLQIKEGGAKERMEQGKRHTLE